MTSTSRLSRTAIWITLAAAVLFGCGTPVAKLLLGDVSPWMLAGLLYLGSGVGLTIFRRVSRAESVQLRHSELAGFGAAVLSGGVVAPVLLMVGLLVYRLRVRRCCSIWKVCLPR
jgi:drug/metabolite transporter (DMT)-like permease